MRITSTCLALLFSLGLAVSTQVPPSVSERPATATPALTGPAGTYQVQAPAPVRIMHGAGSITLVWDGAPSPPVIDPAPPDPVTPPSPAPRPAPTRDPEMEAAARAYARGLIEATAQGWETAASELEKNATVRDALAKGAQVQYDQRLQSLRKHVTPSLNRVLPEGAEPASPEQRDAIVKAYRGLASELRRAPQ